MGKKSRLKKLGVKKKNKLTTAEATSSDVRNLQMAFSQAIMPWVDRQIPHDDDYRLYRQFILKWYAEALGGNTIEDGRRQIAYMRHRMPEGCKYLYKTTKYLLDKADKEFNSVKDTANFKRGISQSGHAIDMRHVLFERVLEWYEPSTGEAKIPEGTDKTDDELYDELYMLCVKYLHYGIDRDDITVTLYTAARRGITDPLLALGKQSLNPRALEQGFQNAVMLKGGITRLMYGEKDSIQYAIYHMINSFNKLNLIANFCIHWKKRGLHTLDDRMNRYVVGDYFADPTDLPDLFDLFEDVDKHSNLDIGHPYAALILAGDAYRTDGIEGLKKTLDAMSLNTQDRLSGEASKLVAVCQQILDPSYCDWMASNRALYLRDVCLLFANLTIEYLSEVNMGNESVVEEIIDWRTKRSTAPAKSLSIQSVLDKLGWTD